MAEWQSGYAADCKSVDLGSIPGSASISAKLSGKQPGCVFIAFNVSVQSRPLLTLAESAQSFFLVAFLGVAGGVDGHVDVLHRG